MKNSGFSVHLFDTIFLVYSCFANIQSPLFTSSSVYIEYIVRYEKDIYLTSSSSPFTWLKTCTSYQNVYVIPFGRKEHILLSNNLQWLQITSQVNDFKLLHKSMTSNYCTTRWLQITAKVNDVKLLQKPKTSNYCISQPSYFWPNPSQNSHTKPDPWGISLVWFGLVSLFDGICGLFNAKTILVEEQQWYHSTHSWAEIKGFNIFPKAINPKVNVIVRLEFELTSRLQSGSLAITSSRRTRFVGCDTHTHTHTYNDICNIPIHEYVKRT